jgi:hypothetical protein
LRLGGSDGVSAVLLLLESHNRETHVREKVQPKVGEDLRIAPKLFYCW